MSSGSFHFQTTVTRVNLALVLQALRHADAPRAQIEADIRALLAGGAKLGREKAVDLLLQYGLAYVNYSQNCVVSHDGLMRFAEIRWSLQTAGGKAKSAKIPVFRPQKTVKHAAV